MDRHPLVSVIVVNWNGENVLDACLSSLCAQTYLSREIIVVDNGSTDGSVELMTRSYGSSVTLITGKENLGFAKAANHGIQAAKGDYIAVLNNDARADPLWLEELVTAAEEGEGKVGMWACKIYVEGTPGLIDCAGHVIYRDGLSRGRGRLDLDGARYSQREEVIFPSGCAALYRKAMLEEIGLFDEDFFLYCEDADLGWRGRRAGWRCLYIPTAIASHTGSASTGPVSLEKAFYTERNRLWLAVKHLPLSLLLVSPVYTLLRWAALGWRLFRPRRREDTPERPAFVSFVVVLMRAMVEALRGVPRMWRKRQALRARQKVSPHEVKAWFRIYKITLRELTGV